MLGKPWVQEMQDTACAVCPVSFGSQHLKNKPGDIKDVWPRESCVLDGTSWLLVSDQHHIEIDLQYIADAWFPKCCLLRRKFKSQSSENKAQIVSVCFSGHCSSFSFFLPSLSLPWLLLFQLLLRFPFILSIPCQQRGSEFPLPWSWGQLSCAFLNCWAEKTITLFIFYGTAFFLVLHCYAQCLLLSFQDDATFSSFRGENEEELQQDIYLLDFCHAEDSAVQGGSPGAFILPRAGASCVQREKRWAGLIISKDVTAQQLIFERLCRWRPESPICTWRPQFKPTSL